MEKEREIRTPELNLLIGKLKKSEDSEIRIDFKNGKREDSMTLEMFVNEVNKFAEGSHIKLNIVTV